jgi:nicotinamide-nucleotide amidase
MRVALLAVGTELLLGDIVNSNAAWLGRRLADAGLEVVASSVVDDDADRIARAVRTALPGQHDALGRADALVITGGIGPTQDDLTRAGLAAAAGVELRRDDALAAALGQRYAALGRRRMPEPNLVQADLPDGATPIENPHGTAPGIRMPLSGGVAYALPGVPHEMRAMVEASVLPDLLARAGRPAAIITRTLRLAGTGESAVAERVSALADRLAAAGNPALSFLAGEGEVRVRLTARADTAAAARALIAPEEAEARDALGQAVYGVDDDTLDAVLHRLLAARYATVAVAESLTGGLLGATLSEMPGASATYRGALVTYATDTKASLAGVSQTLLDDAGPVAADVAAAMAEGARDRLEATYGLGLTGVAGPQEQDGQPVGTVHVGFAGPDGTAVRSARLPGDRPRIRRRAVVAALDLLRRHLEGSSASAR